jgi:hypothetical protein
MFFLQILKIYRDFDMHRESHVNMTSIDITDGRKIVFGVTPFENSHTRFAV